eukprot:COSAG02_NODE_28963_length_578_cov_2.855950_1_plen_113_part_00
MSLWGVSLQKCNSESGEAVDRTTLQRSQAELTALLQQCGCTSAAELGTKFAYMKSRLDAVSLQDAQRPHANQSLWTKDKLKVNLCRKSPKEIVQWYQTVRHATHSPVHYPHY